MRFWPWSRPKLCQPLDLTAYRGNWVAVKGGCLVAYERTAYALIERLNLLGERANGTTLWFEEHPENVQRWAVMYPSRPNYICPNCWFETREQAERWVEMWRHSGEEVGYVVTRAGQHAPWLPILAASSTPTGDEP